MSGIMPMMKVGEMMMARIYDELVSDARERVTLVVTRQLPEMAHADTLFTH